MRVIAGIAKGRRLIPPDGLQIRPTADRMKEALFSSIGEEIRESFFLDLFSGTGAIGIEALSRGAASAVFVDKSGALIAKNIALAGFQDQSRIVSKDFALAIEALTEPFDIIFMDPPYHQGFVQTAIERILTRGLLPPGGLLIAEQATDEPPPPVESLILDKRKTYGVTTFLFYRKVLF